MHLRKINIGTADRETSIKKNIKPKYWKEKISKERFPKSLPSFGSIAPTVSGFKSTGASYTWLLKEWIKGEGNDLLGSSIDIQTDNEWTRADFEFESSSAWPNILATKLQENKGFNFQLNMPCDIVAYKSCSNYIETQWKRQSYCTIRTSS